MVKIEAVAPVDYHAVARGRAAVAAVIGSCHVDAGLVQRPERRAAGLLLPRPIPPANAFADRTAGAGEVKAAIPVEPRLRPSASGAHMSTCLPVSSLTRK